MKQTLLFSFLLLSVFSCTRDELSNPLDARLETTLKYLSPEGDLAYYQLPSATDLSAIPAGRQNPLTREKVALGQLLFFETGLARKAKHADGAGTYSCSSCHVPAAGFMPGRLQGIADGGLGFGATGEGRDRLENYPPGEMDVQGARPLSLLNVAYVTNTSWTGKFGAHDNNEGTEYLWGEADEATEVNYLGLDGLESQNIEGLKIHRLDVDDYVLDELGYRAYFDQAFGDWPTAERYGLKAASFAISAYLRTLLTTEAPFQKWLKGDFTALSDTEKRGALLFFGKAGCFRCHQGPALNANEFYALGVRDLYETGAAYQTSKEDIRNFGRGGFTGRAEDMFAYKVPGIYNMSETPFYFHGSSKRSLREVVEYFNEGVPENERVPRENIAPQLHPLGLTDQEIEELLSFLEESLHDPSLMRYVPEQVLSGNCFPNNDAQSQQDLGCR